MDYTALVFDKLTIKFLKKLPELDFYIYRIRQKIPRKCQNSTEMDKFRSSAQNSTLHGELWSLAIGCTSTQID